MASIAAWTVLDRKITFADPRLRIRSDLCLTPQGEVVGPAHVIEYPDRVTIVAIGPGGSKILLVPRYQHGIGSVVTGLPNGVVDRTRGTPHLDGAEMAAQLEHRASAHRAGLAALPDIRPGSENSAAPFAAVENAARHELLEAAGCVANEWTCLLKSHPDSSGQTNTAYCFLATSLERLRVPPSVLAGDANDIIEHDFLAALRLVQQGSLTMDVLDAAALWSAASHIAADRSGRFGPLSMQLRRFFVGEDDMSSDEPFIPAPFPSSTVGG
jgi:hypothetical protein